MLIAAAVMMAFLVLLPEAGLTIFAALMLTAWCKPAVDRLVQLGWARGSAALLPTGLFTLALALFVYLSPPHIANEVVSAQSLLSTERLQQRLSNIIIGSTGLTMSAGASHWQHTLEPAALRLLDSALYALTQFWSYMNAAWPHAIIVAVMTFFLLRDHAALSRGVVTLASNPNLTRWIVTAEKIKADWTDLAQNFMPRLLLAGGMAYAALALIGAPFIIGLAVIIAAALLVPYFGALLAIVPVILISAAHAGSWSIAVAIVITVATLRLIDQLLFGRRRSAFVTKWHPLAVVLIVLVGWALWGFWGVYVALPLAAGIFSIAGQIRQGYEAFGHS